MQLKPWLPVRSYARIPFYLAGMTFPGTSLARAIINREFNFNPPLKLLLGIFITCNINKSIANSGDEHEPSVGSSSTATAFQDTLSESGNGPLMVVIPQGSFLMGDKTGEGKSYERPRHKVNIRYKLAVSKFPITFNDYDKFSQATGRQKADQYKWPRDLHPVINVNWEDAKAYAKWLSKQTNGHYRLPSEAEWEYIARAGSTSNYPWGDNIGINNAHCSNCGDLSTKNQTAPIGKYPPNKWNIHGLIGNVWEMTADCWNYNYINAPTDGSAWQNGDCSRLVLRGGSWGDVSNDLRSATRLRSYAGARTVNIGFRVVKELNN